ncbi:Uncharacterised protein [Citrobacter freundii]|nr:Uncharacterised protein [Citrobacter freundii]
MQGQAEAFNHHFDRGTEAVDRHDDHQSHTDKTNPDRYPCLNRLQPGDAEDQANHDHDDGDENGTAERQDVIKHNASFYWVNRALICCFNASSLIPVSRAAPLSVGMP